MGAIQQFEIDYLGVVADVVEHQLPSGRVFHIEFGSPATKPLVITVAKRADGKKFWTSVPEGRQEEAEVVGKLVATYIRTH
jgi:hypothetical protein